MSETNTPSPSPRDSVEDLMRVLKGTRDELKLQMHLANAELRAGWDGIDKKYQKMVSDYEPLKDAASESAADVWESLKLVGEELREGFDRMRRALR